MPMDEDKGCLMRCKFAGLLFLVITLYSWISYAGTNMSPAFVLPPGAKPVVVKVGVTVDDVSAMSEVTETTTIAGTLSMQWLDSRLKFTPTKGRPFQIYTGDDAIKKFKTIWSPQIIIPHVTAPRETLFLFLMIDSNGLVTSHERFRVTAETPMMLHRFPFDTQQFIFDFRPFYYPSTQVQLEAWPDWTGFVSRTYLEEWQVASFNQKVQRLVNRIIRYPIDTYSLQVHLKRIANYYVIQVIMPMMLIVLLSFVVFWMTHNPLVNRVSISFTALLTIVVFQWRVRTNLPHLAYATFLDVFMIYSFLMAGMTILGSLLIEHWEKHREKEIHIFRLMSPIVYVGGLLILAMIYLL